MQSSWPSLVPPLLVLALSFSTKRVVPALLVGIASACMIAAHFSLYTAVTIAFNTLWAQFDLANSYIFIFLIALGALIALVYHSGGTAAYGNLLRKKLHNAKNAETASLFLSLLFLIDDFFSCITVGNVMQPITDYFKIPRAKLAFLIDAMASPWVVLMPVSSWVATLSMQLNKAGISEIPAENPLISADPYIMFLKIIPYIFYSYIIIGSVFFIVRRSISFGPMHEHEVIAKKTGNLFGGKNAVLEKRSEQHSDNGSLADFLLPIGLLIASVLLYVLYTGNWSFFGGNNSFISAFQHTDIFFSLCAGSIITLLLTSLWFWYKKTFSVTDLYTYSVEGAHPMISAIIVLFFAWTFSALLKDYLHAGDYLAQLLLGKLNIALLPVLFFIASGITSIATGSSWGTIGVMVPIAVPMVVSLFNVTLPVNPDTIAIIYPVLGAIFAGAIAGDHISPISTTTLMSSQSAGAHHADHVHTQALYAIAPLITTCFAYTISGFLWQQSYWLNAIISIGSALIICLISLYVLNKKQ